MYVGWQVDRRDDGRFYANFVVGAEAERRFVSAAPGHGSAEEAETDARQFFDAIQDMKPPPEPVRYIPEWVYVVPPVIMQIAFVFIARSGA